jgi:hypothetical protein
VLAPATVRQAVADFVCADSISEPEAVATSNTIDLDFGTAHSLSTSLVCHYSVVLVLLAQKVGETFLSVPLVRTSS